MQLDLKVWEFCQHSGCLFLIAEVRDDQLRAHDVEALDAYFTPTLPNAWLDLRFLATGALELRGSVMIPAGTDPDDLDIALMGAAGEQLCRIALHQLAEGRRPQTAGLIAVTQEDDGSRWEFWADGKSADLFMGACEGEKVSRQWLPSAGVFYHSSSTASGHAGDAGQAIKVIPDVGEGQQFSDFGGMADGPLEHLEPFRDMHKGQAAWLIGNGPSVRFADLEKLSSHLTFSFNRFYLAHQEIAMRPTYTVSADRQMIDDFGSEIVEKSSGTVFLASDTRPDVPGNYQWVRQKSCYPSLFSRDASRYVTTGGSSVFVAVQLGYFMGIRRFYLYGADFNFTYTRVAQAADIFRSVSGDDNHFVPGYRSGKNWCPPAYRFIANAFWAARCLLESEGGFIKNVTHGGLLEVFEREDFDAALAGDKFT